MTEFAEDHIARCEVRHRIQQFRTRRSPGVV